IIELARQYGRYGYRKIAELLRQAGWTINDKRVERIWQREGLKVPHKQPKRGRLWLTNGSCIRLRPEQRNHVWSYDFVEDRTHDGPKYRMLNVLDEFSHEPGLRLYDQNGKSGVEFPVEDGRIDILATDANNHFVVIELKVGRGRNRALGQLLYYMGWVDKHLGNGQCRGIIIAKDIPEDLVLAVQRVPGVSLYSYKLAVSVELVSSQTATAH